MALLVAVVLWPYVDPYTYAASVGRLAGMVRLLPQKSKFESQFKGLPPIDGPLWVDDWSVWVTNSTFVIYDASGKIARPKSDEVWTSDDMKLFRMCAGHVFPIYGNYYRCDI